MEKIPTNEMSNITRLQTRLDAKIYYEKLRKRYSRNLNFQNLKQLNKRKPQPIPTSLILDIASPVLSTS